MFFLFLSRYGKMQGKVYRKICYMYGVNAYVKNGSLNFSTDKTLRMKRTLNLELHFTSKFRNCLYQRGILKAMLSNDCRSRWSILIIDNNLTSIYFYVFHYTKVQKIKLKKPTSMSAMSAIFSIRSAP